MGISDLIKAVVDLVKGGPAYLRVVVVFFFLAVIGVVVWRTLDPPKPPPNFVVAFDEATKTLQPGLGTIAIMNRIEYLMAIAQTDDQRCRVGFLYLNVATGLSSPPIPNGLRYFIETGSQRNLPCVAELASEAHLLAATQPRAAAAAQILVARSAAGPTAGSARAAAGGSVATTVLANAAPPQPASSPPAPSATVGGIDVSFFQSPVDWKAVAGAGVRFAVIKASEGASARDGSFPAFWSGAQRAGLVRGAYHTFVYGVDPAVQAKNFLGAVSLQAGDLPAILDAEPVTSEASPPSGKGALAWLRLVAAATHKKPIVYAGYAFANRLVRESPEFGSYPLWIASHGDAVPVVPAGWPGWTLWQYDERGKVPGVTGPVDLDRFNGTLDRLRGLN